MLLYGKNTKKNEKTTLLSFILQNTRFWNKFFLFLSCKTIKTIIYIKI